MADPTGYRSSLDPPGSSMGENALSNGATIIPMEMEEEMDSLVHETGDFTGIISKVTHRKRYNADGTARESSSRATAVSTTFRGFLRTKTAYVIRNAIFLACLAWLVLLFVGKMGSTVSDIEDNDMADHHAKEGPHQSSFGGIKNVGQVEGAKAHANHSDVIDQEELAAWISAEDNSGQPVASFSEENIINHIGHYWHDPRRSPFASHLYKRPDQEMDAEQQEFEHKMNVTNEKFGQWTLVDTYFTDTGKGRPKPDFGSVKNRDLPVADFPEGSWQTDEEYVGKFVDQARAMIQRVREGIYTEYGHATVAEDGTPLSGDALAARNALFQVIIQDYQVVDGKATSSSNDNSTEPLPGIAYLSQVAWDALVRKLLHALVTNDMFFVVMAGDEIAAGHRGNNFLLTPIMQFHYLMEPVLDLLGIKLVSRNMAMGYADTTLSALGGADIYGETDIMWYYQGRKVETQGQLDFFHKQAILSGERVPILLTQDPVNLEVKSKGAAWIGNLQPGAEMCPVSQEKEYTSLIDACQMVHCPTSGFWACEEFNSVCWVDRVDVEPPVEQTYIRVPRGKRVPGYRKNKLEARKLSLLLLQALDAAFDKWVDGIEDDGFPLADSHWHINDLYDVTREAVRVRIPRFNENVPECDSLFKDFPIVCHVEMHAFTECSPRVNPSRSSLSNAIYPTMLDSLDFEGEEELYADIDILPLQWKAPLNLTDVHAIAISTAVSPTADDGCDTDDNYACGTDDDTAWIDTNDDLVDDENATQPVDNGNASDTGGKNDDAIVDQNGTQTSDTGNTSDTNGTNNFVGHQVNTQPSESGNTSDIDTKPPTRRVVSRHGETALSSSGLNEKRVEASLRTRRADASASNAITPGKGWMVWNHIPGFCDGSAQSTCNRSNKNPCLLAGHNDFPGGILGDALSGWLMLQLTNVKEGIILARLDTSVKSGVDTATEDWTSVNGGADEDGNRVNRQLNIPADFQFDYAINGNVTTLLRSEFLAFGREIVDGLTLYPLLMDESISEDHGRDADDEGETIDVAIRVRSAQGRDATALLTHLYYA